MIEIFYCLANAHNGQLNHYKVFLEHMLNNVYRVYKKTQPLNIYKYLLSFLSWKIVGPWEYEMASNSTPIALWKLIAVIAGICLQALIIPRGRCIAYITIAQSWLAWCQGD